MDHNILDYHPEDDDDHDNNDMNDLYKYDVDVVDTPDHDDKSDDPRQHRQHCSKSYTHWHQHPNRMVVSFYNEGRRVCVGKYCTDDPDHSHHPRCCGCCCHEIGCDDDHYFDEIRFHYHY